MTSTQAPALPGPAALRRMMNFYAEQAGKLDVDNMDAVKGSPQERRNDNGMQTAWKIYFNLQKLVCMSPAKNADDALSVVLCANSLVDEALTGADQEVVQEALHSLECAVAVLTDYIFGLGPDPYLIGDDNGWHRSRMAMVMLAHGMDGGAV